MIEYTIRVQVEIAETLDPATLTDTLQGVVVADLLAIDGVLAVTVTETTATEPTIGTLPAGEEPPSPPRRPKAK